MRNHKWRIIVPALVAAALVFAFWYGGAAPGSRGWEAGHPAADSDTTVNAETETENETGTAPQTDAARPESGSAGSTASATPSAPESPTPDIGAIGAGTESAEAEESASAEDEPSPSSSDDAPAPSDGDEPGASPPGGDLNRPMTADEKQALAETMADAQGAEPSPSGDASYSALQGMKINPESGKDRYMTEPVPEGRPVPVEPQDTVVSDTALTCTLSVRCDTILDNMDWLDPEKVELIPPDGVILPAVSVTFYEGESVFDVLRRETRRAGIHLEFANTPMYNSAYIEGINNIYEFDCGELSGWMYKVNDWFPSYGCSRYQLKDGDVVEWVYTCSLGVDVGGYYSVGS
jgi:hypothetical protein